MKRLLAALFVVLASPAFAGQAIPVNEFLSSLGVNTHMAQGYPEAAYEQEFTYTGIRNVRDGDKAYPALVTLHNHTKSSTYPGVKANILASSPNGVISRATALVNAGALLSIEGPNEPNNFPITYNGVKGGDNLSWVPVAQFQRDLYAAIKGNSTLKGYPVFGVSETGGETDNVGLQCLVLDSTCAGAAGVTLMAQGTRYADYANPHNYVQRKGRCYTPSPNQAWNAEDPTLNSCWDGIYGDNVLTWNKHFHGYSVAQAMIARVTSETGWNSDSPSLDYQGKVLLNVYLDAFKRGWAYTFVYEMVDAQGSPSNQGFYTRTNVAKPSATYVHNMTTILADTTNFSAGSLGYSVANEPATVHDMLLQKSKGTYYLAIWDEHTAPQYTDRVTVTLSQAATVTEYDPTRGTTPIATFTNVTSVPLTLSDHVVFLVIP